VEKSKQGNIETRIQQSFHGTDDKRVQHVPKCGRPRIQDESYVVKERIMERLEKVLKKLSKDNPELETNVNAYLGCLQDSSDVLLKLKNGVDSLVAAVARVKAGRP
jgi:hypothetical protein